MKAFLGAILLTFASLLFADEDKREVSTLLPLTDQMLNLGHEAFETARVADFVATYHGNNEIDIGVVKIQDNSKSIQTFELNELVKNTEYPSKLRTPSLTMNHSPISAIQNVGRTCRAASTSKRQLADIPISGQRPIR